MHKEAKEELRVRLKLAVLELADDLGVTKGCQEYNVPRSSFYHRKQKYEKAGRSGLYRERPVAYRHPRRTSLEVVEKILATRTEDQIGALRMLTYTDDIDLHAKLKACENFYNYDRPHLSLDGQTPYEVVKSLLK